MRYGVAETGVGQSRTGFLTVVIYTTTEVLAGPESGRSPDMRLGQDR